MDRSEYSGKLRTRKRARSPTPVAQTDAEMQAQREAEQRAKKDERNARRRKRRAEQNAARARAGRLDATAGDCRENQVGEASRSRHASRGRNATGTNGQEKPTLSLRKMKERLKTLSPDNGQHSNDENAAPELPGDAEVADLLLSLKEGSWPEQSSSRPGKRVRIVTPDTDDEEEPLSASAATKAGPSTAATHAPANAAPPVTRALLSSIEEQQLVVTARRSALPLLAGLSCLVPYREPYESRLHESYARDFEERGGVLLHRSDIESSEQQARSQQGSPP